MTKSTTTQSKSITHKLPPVWVNAAVDAAATTLLLLLLLLLLLPVMPRALVVVLAAASWGPKFLRFATMRRSYFLIASAPWIPSKTVCP